VVAHEARRAPGPWLRLDDAALKGPQAAFKVDPSRLYEVGDDGGSFVAPTDRETRPSGRVWRWWIAAVALNFGSAGTTVAAFMLGGRPAGAAMGLVVMGTAPLLAVAPALAWWQKRRLHRRQHSRPERFR
jgi:hypothetical protein